jgi:uncharacterized protein
VANPFIHVELNTADPQKAKSFYSKLFQWQLEDVPNPAVPGRRLHDCQGGNRHRRGHHEADAGRTRGMARVHGNRRYPRRAQRAKTLGAKIMKDVTEVMGIGPVQLHSALGVQAVAYSEPFLCSQACFTHLPTLGVGRPFIPE